LRSWASHRRAMATKNPARSGPTAGLTVTVILSTPVRDQAKSMRSTFPKIGLVMAPPSRRASLRHGRGCHPVRPADRPMVAHREAA
jgi:hypothetical protein